jgi:hypothetical protein
VSQPPKSHPWHSNSRSNLGRLGTLGVRHTGRGWGRRCHMTNETRF